MTDDEILIKVTRMETDITYIKATLEKMEARQDEILNLKNKVTGGWVAITTIIIVLYTVAKDFIGASYFV